MPEQVADQRPIVGDLAGAGTVTDSGGLDDRSIIPHHIAEADETVVEHAELLPAQPVDQFPTVLAG